MSEKKQYVKGFTPKLVCGPFPKVFEAESFKGGKPVYKIRVIGSKAELSDFLAKVEEVAEQALEDARTTLEDTFKNAKTGKEKGVAKEELAKLKPADRPYKPVYDDDGNETDDIIVQFKQNATYKDKKTQKIMQMRKPAVVDYKGNPLKREIRFGEGSIVIVAYEISPFYTAAVGAGASLRLQGVQIIKAVAGGGGPSFGAQEDGEDIDYDGMGFTPQEADAPAAEGAGESGEAEAF